MKITQANAERLVLSRHPRASCSGQSSAGGRYYLVHLNGGTAGEMYVGEGRTKREAWKQAAESMEKESI